MSSPSASSSSAPSAPPPAGALASSPSSPADGVAPPSPVGEPQKATLLDAAKTISPLSDLQRLPQIPCSRTSLLFGIVAGACVGGLRFVFSRTGRRGSLYGGGGGGPWSEIGTAANWAVGAWGVGSLGAWETCRARQTAEAARMQALVHEIKTKRAAKAARQQARAEQLEAAGGGQGGGAVGGILMGEKGREMLEERRRAEGGEAKEEKKSGGWFSGRV